MTTTTTPLPHWDMTVVYPSLDSPEFEEGMRSFVRDLDDLTRLFDRHGVEKRDPTPLGDQTVRAFEEVIDRFNAVLEHARTLGSYIYGLTDVDSRDNLAQAKQSEYEQHSVRLSQLGTRFTAWIGSLDVEELIERSEAARDHAFALREAKIEAEHLMSPAEEALAAELEVTSGTAWGKLHDNVTSQIMVPIELDGERQELPMTVVRNLAFNPDRDVRRTAYEAEIQAWERHALPLAAALNSIKGEVNTLSRRRGWGSALDEALFRNRIDRQTLDAMFEAARESFPDFRRYLRAKARALGLPVIAWFDRVAPVGASSREWEYDEASRFIVEHFGSYSEKLAGLARRAFAESWIDAEPRSGKRGGAYCMSLRAEESRILANYTTSYQSVSTLAHELGHAYHNLNKASRTPIQRQTPMTLAETASIFCETIVRHAALREADEQEQLMIVDGSLSGSFTVVVGVTSYFMFEQRLFEERRAHELSIDELRRLTRESQEEVYEDSLDPATYHTYFWAVAPHFYSTSRSYYNFPYMFGLLFGLGLYARYQADPEGFKAGYDELLASTGLADATTLASGFGIDIRTPDFWRDSLDVVRQDIDLFDRLTASTAGQPSG